MRRGLLPEGAVVDEGRETRLVEARREVGLGDGEADGVGDALAEGPRGDLDAVEQECALGIFARCIC